MPAYKNQHYVPQFYMRNFLPGSEDRIYLYNFDARQEFHDSTKNVCSSSWFYDDKVIRDSEDSAVIEKKLGRFEGEFSESVRDILDKRRLDTLSTESVRNALRFVSFQAFRTKSAIEDYQNQMDVIATEEGQKRVWETDLPDDQKKELAETDWTTDAPVKMWTVVQSLTAEPFLYDLHSVLIKNDTNVDFVFSDEPVILDNMRFKDEYDAPLVGLQNGGIQIHVPLSNTDYLLMYDPNCYTIDYDNQDQRTLTVSNRDVVNSLNKAQIVNGVSNVLYGNDGRQSEIEGLHDEVTAHMNWDRRSPPDSIPDNVLTDNTDSMRMTPPYSPELPFLSIEHDSEYEFIRNHRLWNHVMSIWEDTFDDRYPDYPTFPND